MRHHEAERGAPGYALPAQPGQGGPVRLPLLPAEPAPVACSLDAAAMRERGEVIAGLADRMTGHVAEERRLTVRFPAAAEDDVRALAAAETRCCGFMDLRVVRAGDEVALTITAPSERALPTLRLFADAFGVS